MTRVAVQPHTLGGIRDLRVVEEDVDTAEVVVVVAVGWQRPGVDLYVVARRYAGLRNLTVVTP